MNPNQLGYSPSVKKTNRRLQPPPRTRHHSMAHDGHDMTTSLVWFLRISLFHVASTFVQVKTPKNSKFAMIYDHYSVRINLIFLCNYVCPILIDTLIY